MQTSVVVPSGSDLRALQRRSSVWRAVQSPMPERTTQISPYCTAFRSIRRAAREPSGVTITPGQWGMDLLFGSASRE